MPDSLAGFGLLLLALVAAAVTARRVSVLFLSYPVPWPDEALFADVATHLVRQGTMGTDLYRECLPGSSAHYYLTPPLYPVMLALAFAVGGARVETMRLASLLAASGVLVVLFAVARRTGMGRFALLPPSLLLLDAVFLRGSLVGRMDMLALGLVLLTLWLLLPGAGHRADANAPRAAGRARSFWVGLVAGLAVDTHPVGLAAAVLALATWAIPTFRRLAGGTVEEEPRSVRLHATWIGLGLVLAVLPWALYVLRDPSGFAEQYGQQLMRKRWEWGFPSLGLAQWGVAPVAAVMVLTAGLAGLAAAALRDRRFTLPTLGQIVLLAIVIPNWEIWYGVYLMPLTYLGIASGMRGLTTSGAWRRATSGAFALVGAVFAILNATRLSGIEPRSSETNAYAAWCRRVSELTPPGATVLMEALPTPYFGLAARSDLSLRLFPPLGFHMDDARIARMLDRVDIVVAGSSTSNQVVRELVNRRGVEVADVGPTHLIKLRRPTP